jgi:haloalkane dehalogenase
MTTTTEVPAEFNFESHYADILGSRMHYVDVGDGDPVIFLHGNPTSSYLWRNVIPHLSDHARCIAPDLIGMGKSDHPDIAYRFDDHYRYLSEFIDSLELDRPVTLVIHDWGSALGFRWAYDNPDRVKGIAFMEAMIKPLNWEDMPKGYGPMFRLLRAPGTGYLLSSVANLFVKKMLPDMVERGLTPQAKKYYESAYPTISSRKPVQQWPCEIPLGGSPADNYATVDRYSKWLTETDLPKILFHASPGAIIRDAEAQWCQDNYSNLEVVNIGAGTHFIQEDNPDLIGTELSRWYAQL